MSYTAAVTENFGGVNLVDDPPEVGFANAVDVLNVDLDRRGRVRQRDGYDNHTSSTVGAVVDALIPFYTDAGTNQLVAGSGSATDYYVYNTSGGLVASSTLSHGVANPGMVRWGDPEDALVYVLANDAGTGSSLYSWDGSSWNAGPIITGAPFRAIGVQAADNRLVIAGGEDAEDRLSQVHFSDAGAPETFSADNVVEIAPGDGERILALPSWGPLLFAFKESKFAVFTGNTTDATGGTIFQYEMVNSGIGTTGAVCSGRPGVFFLNRRGVYVTQGGQPQLISRALDPLFLGTVPDTYSGSAINQAQIAKARMTWMDERLYVAVPTGSSTTSDRMLVWDSIRDDWTIWNIPAASLTSWRVTDREELFFGYATGSTHIGRHNSTFTTDDGTNISSFYRSGFTDFGSNEQKVLRETLMHGTGSVGYSVATDYGDADSAATVTLGTSPDVAESRDRVARRGRLFSFRLASVAGGAWAVHRLTHHVRDQRQPGVKG